MTPGATLPSFMQPVITTLTGSLLGNVFTVTISDNRPTGVSTQTWRVTRDKDGKWIMPPDLSTEIQQLLKDFADRSATLT